MINLLRQWKLLVIGGLGIALMISLIQIGSLQNDISSLKVGQAEAYSNHIEMVVEKERELKEITYEISKSFEKEKIKIQADADRIIHDLESNNLRLRANIATAELSDYTLSDASKPNDQAQCRLSREASQFLVREAARADRNTKQLNNLIEAVESSQKNMP